MTFKDKVAIITGGASGIGRAIAQEMAKEKAILVIADVNIEQAKQVAEKIQERGAQASAYEVDVRDANAVQKLVEETVEKHGRLDYMFNNAGIAMLGEMDELTIEQFDRIFDVNVRGVMYGIHAACAVMKKQGYGHIVNTASVAGLITAPQIGAYCGTKHAVVGLSQSLRITAKPYGIKVSAVCPGFVETAIADSMEIANEEKYIERSEIIGSNPIKHCPVDKAARTIIKGVKRNKAVIVVTLHAHILWRLFRFFPWLASMIIGNMYHKQEKSIRK
ncbi:SDR family NAD(P)-dependent oxidoreductase [Candidatus Uabimicrobium amorphum]|uniref:Short-chain dehydrogenase n=1 Tax=Uabimicrobium amorphum TaxID=2596890 RepID=A0A5S9IP91_UABAM|nr:SDR family NAD(P)-dependent oxidoreductase [Candidatus Uabimicrobium amorphum]BBM84660.1 short-chain dehydrogenase [Candidatus Uabimicrobium amorphum]